MDPVLSNIVVPIVLTLGVNAIVYLLAIGQYKNKVDDLVEYKKDSTKDLKKISDRLSRLQGGIDRDREYNLSLTEKGKALLLDSKGQDLVDENIDKLAKEVDDMRPKTPYDVQEYAKQVLLNNQNEDWFLPLKDFLYREGLPLETLINVLGIYFRDKLLARKHWDIKDIDKYDPSKKQLK